MNKCLTCGEQNPTKKIISKGKILTGCEACLPTQLQQGDDAKFQRDWQRKEYRKDITQPNQGRDFIKAYGIDRAREYMDDSTIRRLS